MVDRSWATAVNGIWSTSARWSPAGVPTSSDNCWVDHSVTISVSSLSSCRDLTINGNVTFSCSSTLQINGSLYNNWSIRQIGTGAIAMVGSLSPVDCNPGDNNFVNFRIAKTSSGNQVFLNGDLNCKQTATSAFRHISGSFYTNGSTIYCNIYDQSSATTRFMYMSSDIYVQGTSGSVCLGGSAALDYLQTDGWVRVQPASGTTTLTVAFGADRLSGPLVQLSSNRNYAASGHVRACELNGAFVSTTNLSLWGDLTGTPTTTSMITGVTINQFAEANQTLAWDYNTLFGTVGFSTTFTGVTFNLDNVRANTVNCNSANTTYNINSINANGTGGFNACALNCNGSGSTYWYNYFRDNATTSNITMGGSTTTTHYIWDINTIGTITYNIGNLELQNWVYCRQFISTSGSTRNFQFNWNWIVVNGNHRSGVNGGTTGLINITGTTSLVSDTETDDGGFILQATGTSAIGTWSATNSVRLIIESLNGATLNPVVGSGQLRWVELKNSISFTTATTLSIIREGFSWNGQGSLNLTNLTIDYIHPTGQSIDYRPSNALTDANYRIGTFRISSTAGDNQTWYIDVYCRNCTLSEPTGTFNLGEVNFTGTLTCSGTSATYNYSGVKNDQGTITAEQWLMQGSSTTVHNIVWYDNSVNGIINHSNGILHLDTDLTCRVFRSTSGATRVWQFNNAWINTTGTGYFDISGTTSITTDSESTGGGFRVKGTGANAFGGASGYQAPRVAFDPQGGSLSTSVTSGNVREVFFESGSITFASSTITFVRYGISHVGGSYNTSLLNCNINFVTDETFNYTHSTIGTLQVSGAPTGRNYYFYAVCGTISISSSSNTYHFENVTHGATVSLSGSSTYNLNYLRSSVGNPSCTLNGSTATYNFGNWQHTGTITHSNGTANINSNDNEFGTWVSTSGATRRFQGNGYFVRILTLLNYSASIAGFTSDSSGGFEMSTGSANLTAIVTTNSNAFDFRLFGNITFVSGGTVNSLIFGGSCGIGTATTINVRANVGQVTPYSASNALSSLTINMLQNGTYDADTPAAVGTVNASMAGQSITVNNMYASTVIFQGQTGSYTINNATAITTLNCAGSGATYNLVYFTGTTVNLAAGSTSGTPTYNIGAIQITGSAAGQGLQFTGTGNLNLTQSPTFYRVNSNTSNTRSINFSTYFIIMEAGGNVNIANSLGFSSTETGGGWKLKNNNTMDMAIFASGASMNIQFQGVLNISTPGNTFIKTLQNYWDGDEGTPGYINSANFTLTVYGGVKLAGDGNLNYGNWSTTNITVINNDTAATPQFTTYPSGASGSVTIPTLDISGAGVTRNLVGNLYVGTFTFNSGGFNLNNNTIFATTCSLNATAKSINSGTSGKIQTTDWLHNNISSMTWTGTGYVEVYSGTLNNGGGGGATTNIANFRIAGNPTVNNNFYANNLTLVGWTPNSSLYRTYIAGNLTYSGGMDSTAFLHTFEFIGTNAASVSTTVAMTNFFPRFIISGGKTLTIQNPILASIIEINASNTLDTNNQAITIDNRVINNGTVTLGSSVITISANGNIWSGSASQIVNGGTSEIKFTGAASFDRTVYFGTGNTLNKLTNATTFSHSGSGDGTGWLIIQSDNLSVALVAKDPGAYSAGFKFTNQGAGIAKVTAFSIDGISGFPTYVQGPITKPGSVGTMTFNWLGVKNSVVSGGAPPGWYANSSIDYGGNTGWIFAAPVNTNNGNGFFVFF